MSKDTNKFIEHNLLLDNIFSRSPFDDKFLDAIFPDRDPDKFIEKIPENNSKLISDNKESRHKPSTHILQLSLEQIVKYDLSKEFLDAEAKFAKNMAQELVKDTVVVNAFKEWPEMNNTQKQDFAGYINEKLNGYTQHQKPDLLFILKDEDKTLGQYLNKFNATLLPENLDKIKDPMVMISVLIHENTGHARQYFNDYGGERPHQDTDVLQTQMQSHETRTTYVNADVDQKSYETQPAEQHARFLQNQFCDHFYEASKTVHADEKGNTLNELLDERLKAQLDYIIEARQQDQENKKPLSELVNGSMNNAYGKSWKERVSTIDTGSILSKL